MEPGPIHKAEDRVAMPNTKTKFGKQRATKKDVVGFSKQLGSFVVTAEMTCMPMVFMGAEASDNAIIFANQAFLRLTGYEEQEILGQSFNFLMESSADGGALTEIRTAFESARDLETMLRCRRKNNTSVWVKLFITPVRDDAGSLVQHVASFVDLTQHKNSEEHLRTLLLELNHRTQNTLATVMAIARLTLHDMTDEGTIATLDGRILALSKIYGLLGAENWDKLRLHDVLNEILLPFGVTERFSLHLDEIRLPREVMETLAMALHELAANAVKHGALSNGSGGRVAITCRLEAIPGKPQMRLLWHESGGPPVSPPEQKGFGSLQINGAAHQLNGTASLNFEPAGVVCEIIVPVSGEWDGHCAG